MTAMSVPAGVYVDPATDVVKPARWENQVLALTGTAAALGSVSGLAQWGFPIDELVFTKSAAVETMTVRVCVSNNGRMLIAVTEAAAETVAVTMKKGSTTLEGNLLVRKGADGTFAAASALVNGNYNAVFD